MNPELIRAFVFMRKDPKFTVKLAILGAAMFVPIVGWILALGYCVMLYRNYIDGKDDEMILPEWEDFGNYVFKGVSFLMRQRVETEIPASLAASFIVSKRVILGHPNCIAYNIVNIVCWRLSLFISNCLYLLALFFRKMSPHYTLIPIIFHI